MSLSGNTYWNFSSNDYLGLSESPILIKAAHQEARRFGVGATGSRLLGGDYTLYHALEEALALFKHKPSALLFNTGYQANSGLIRCIVGPGDVVFADKLIHASLLDGIALSKATLFRFSHNAMPHLERLLKKHRHEGKKALIISETVFSMEGDTAPVQALIQLKLNYHCDLFLDEAHAIGVMGNSGEGLIDSKPLAEHVDYMVGTFGKAFGGFGAFVACSETFKQHLITTCRSFVFSTALPPAVIASNLAALALIQTKKPYRAFQKKVNLFRKYLLPLGPQILGTTHIIPILYKDPEITQKKAFKLQEKGFWIQPIHPPTVPAGQSRLRISLSLAHPNSVLEALSKSLRV